MAIISLSEAKLHLRVTHDDEDDIIQIYVNAAIQYVKTFLDRDITPNNAAIKAGALLVVSDLYENREGRSDVEIKDNPAVMSLLYPYRRNIGI